MNRDNDDIEEVSLEEIQNQINKLGVKIHKGYFKSQ